MSGQKMQREAEPQGSHAGTRTPITDGPMRSSMEGWFDTFGRVDKRTVTTAVVQEPSKLALLAGLVDDSKHTPETRTSAIHAIVSLSREIDVRSAVPTLVRALDVPEIKEAAFATLVALSLYGQTDETVNARITAMAKADPNLKYIGTFVGLEVLGF